MTTTNWQQQMTTYLPIFYLFFLYVGCWKMKKSVSSVHFNVYASTEYLIRLQFVFAWYIFYTYKLCMNDTLCHCLPKYNSNPYLCSKWWFSIVTKSRLGVVMHLLVSLILLTFFLLLFLPCFLVFVNKMLGYIRVHVSVIDDKENYAVVTFICLCS